MKKWSGSYTVEAAVIVPLLIWAMALGMHTGIDLLQEVYSEHEEQQLQELWEVEPFYKYQILKGATE